MNPPSIITARHNDSPPFSLAPSACFNTRITFRMSPPSFVQPASSSSNLTPRANAESAIGNACRNASILAQSNTVCTTLVTRIPFTVSTDRLHRSGTYKRRTPLPARKPLRRASAMVIVSSCSTHWCSSPCAAAATVPANTHCGCSLPTARAKCSVRSGGGRPCQYSRGA